MFMCNKIVTILLHININFFQMKTIHPSQINDKAIKGIYNDLTNTVSFILY